jgi:hypothetical protein
VVLITLKGIHVTHAMRNCPGELEVLIALFPNAEFWGKVHRERQAGDPNRVCNAVGATAESEFVGASVRDTDRSA